LYEAYPFTLDDTCHEPWSRRGPDRSARWRPRGRAGRRSPSSTEPSRNAENARMRASSRRALADPMIAWITLGRARVRSARPHLGAHARGDEQRGAGRVAVRRVPCARGVHHGLALAKVHRAHLAVDLLVEGDRALDADHQLVALGVHLPRV